jgi:hypothetical protein
VEKPGRTRRYHVPPDALRTITAIHGHPRPRARAVARRGEKAPLGGNRNSWTVVERDYENLRAGMQNLFADLGLNRAAA